MSFSLGRRSLALSILVAGVVIACLFMASDAAEAKGRDYYKILGVSKKATTDQIKKAYRKLSLKFHPDKCKKESCKQKFIDVSNAYEVLSDEEKRKIYDEWGEDGPKQQPGGGGGHGGSQFHFHSTGGGGGFADPFEMFKRFFGGGGDGGFFGGGGGGRGGGQQQFNFGGMPGMGGMGGMPGMGGMGGMPGKGGPRQGRRGGGAGFQGGPPPQQGGGFYDGTHVTELSDQNWKKTVKDSEIWMIEFYAPWCGHCKSLKPHWIQAAKKLKGAIRVGAVNCDAHQQLCGRYGVRGYPTIMLFDYKKHGQPEPYQQERSAQAIANFALSRLPNNVKTLSSKSIDKFISSDGEKHKVLLFSAKSAPTPMFKSLALQFKKHVNFGLVPQSDKALVTRFKVSKFPSILLRLPGEGSDQELTQWYKGALTHEEIAAFLKSYVLKDGKTKPSQHSASSQKQQQKKSAEKPKDSPKKEETVSTPQKAAEPEDRGTFRELTPQTLSALKPNAFSLIFFLDGPSMRRAMEGSGSNDVAKRLLSLAKSYKNERSFNFLWIDATSPAAAHLKRELGVESSDGASCSSAPAAADTGMCGAAAPSADSAFVAVYRPKAQKAASATVRLDSSSLLSDVSRLAESLVGGGVRFVKVASSVTLTGAGAGAGAPRSNTRATQDDPDIIEF